MGRHVHTPMHVHSAKCALGPASVPGARLTVSRGDADEISKQKMTSEANMDMSCAWILQTFGIRLEHRR